MNQQVGTMSPEQNAIFHAQMNAYAKDEVAGVLLAFFLGCFGAHHFYLRRTGLGVLYLLFFWTGITAILGFVECFLMPGRVRRYNLEQASLLAANLLPGVPAVLAPAAARHCATCGTAVAAGVRFCGRCGAAVV